MKSHNDSVDSSISGNIQPSLLNKLLARENKNEEIYSVISSTFSFGVWFWNRVARREVRNYLDRYPRAFIKSKCWWRWFVELVPPKVVAVGSNSEYIVVKQFNKESKEIAYFYLEKTKDNIYKNASEITKGPLSEAEFIELSKKLGLPKITKEFHY